MQGVPSMRMKDFVNRIQNELQKVLESEEILVHDADDCISLESGRFIYKLQKLLAAYAKSNSETEELNLTLFIDLLVERKIFDTDGLWSHNIYSHANKISLRIAEFLGEATGHHPFTFLFPDLKVTEFNFRDKINSMILSDDNTQLINVLTCLERTQREAEAGFAIDLKYTHAGKNPSSMTEDEKNRVINFNPQAKRYYTEIKQGSTQSKRRAHNDLSKNIGFKPNTVTYGKEGADLLKSRLYIKEDELTREKLIERLLEYPPQLRATYLNNISIGTLKRVLCDDLIIKKAMVNKIIYTGKDNHDSALCHAFFVLYQKELHLRDCDYAGYGGRFTGYSKLEKEKACQIPLAFFAKGGSIRDYPEYLNSPQFAKEKPALANGWDTLSTMSNQVVTLASPAYTADIQKLQTQIKLTPKQERRSWFSR